MSRIAIVDYNRCKPKKCNFECGLKCPKNIQGTKCIEVIDMEDMGKKAYISSELCIGCGMCVKKCPFSAIQIINLPKELNANKRLYSYGDNAFRIYRYPSIKKGYSIGFLGANSLGKSTILKIMIGEINVDNKMFVGDELYKYMCLLKENKLTISYKPQEIGQYSKLETKVSDFIKDSNLAKSKYLEQYQLQHLLDRQLKQLSGGEMQRLIIAKTCSKEADAYFFDEPSAFLDIKQRIVASNLIKEKCTENSYSVCVEHDLCILDFICDYIVCLYGEKNAYGVVTSVSSTKHGINSYLEGYFKNENLKFRNEPVTFNKFIVEKGVTKEESIHQYGDLSIKYDNFSLEVKGGNINLSEIVLLIGENGTGKTSFIQRLAKDGAIISSVKRQNPYIKYEGKVIDFLEGTINQALGDQRFVTGIIKALEIDKLYDIEVNNLSGGQMQKLSIITCLGRKANLYLLDEPSAFIDVEDRCKLAKIIKQFTYDYKKTVFIIEHDITLATNIADKVIVFEGQPGIKCYASEPCDLATGVNKFLKSINVTMRKDAITGRPGINKPESQKDKEQKQNGNYYITDQ
jgi:ATP-binding cassette, sub-family E, member 1